MWKVWHASDGSRLRPLRPKWVLEVMVPWMKWLHKHTQLITETTYQKGHGDLERAFFQPVSTRATKGPFSKPRGTPKPGYARSWRIPLKIVVFSMAHLCFVKISKLQQLMGDFPMKNIFKAPFLHGTAWAATGAFTSGPGPGFLGRKCCWH